METPDKLTGYINKYKKHLPLLAILFILLCSSFNVRPSDGTPKFRPLKSQSDTTLSTEIKAQITSNKREASLYFPNSVARFYQINAFQPVIASHKTQNFTFKKAVPIQITYLTCEMQEGTLITYKDIYNLISSLK